MIKFENTEVFNIGGAVRGMRNHMNSWNLSDSCCTGSEYVIGPRDLDLMKRLISARPSHRKVLRQIFVCVDIIAPLYWFKEFDQYKISTTTNSCSTMHKIHAKEFILDDFSIEHLIEHRFNYPEPSADDSRYNYLGAMKQIIEALNAARSMFLATKDKKYWWQMIQLLPSSYNQKRTVTIDYETLLNIYQTRKNHKLDEWDEFRKWIETLPYTKELFPDE